MNPLIYVLLSFIQAATEFLPISSSGHLLFFKGLLHNLNIPLIFDIIIHIGSLIAIIIFYHKNISFTIRNSFLDLIEKREEKSNIKFVLYAAISTVATIIFYFLLRTRFEIKFHSPSNLFISYLITTIIIFATYFTRKREKNVIVKKGFLLPIIVGLFQGLAIIPGISRSGITISILLIMGIKRDEATYYSFFLAIPAILGAFVFKSLEKDSVNFIVSNWGVVALSLGVSISFSLFFLKLLTRILHKGKFWRFSIYTLILAFISLIIF